MKKYNFLIILLVIIVLLLTGCSGRDTSTPEKALLGHWVTESGKTHYYFNQDKLVMIDEGRKMDMTYSILESNNTENWIKIRVRTEYEMGHDKTLKFSFDRKSLAETIVMLGNSADTKWNYVDHKQEP